MFLVFEKKRLRSRFVQIFYKALDVNSTKHDQ